MKLLHPQFCKKMETLADVFRHVHFENAMKHLYRQIDHTRDGQKKLAYIDYFMDCIRRDLQSDLRTHKIYHDKMSDFEPNDILPKEYRDVNSGYSGHYRYTVKYENQDILTDQVVLVPTPWKSDKLCDLLSKILHEGFQKGKQTTTYYKQLGIATVSNGNHSLSVEVYLHQQDLLNATVYDIAPMFPHVECCGTYWFDRYTQSQIGKITDFRIAILYEAAKLKFNLEQQQCPKSS